MIQDLQQSTMTQHVVKKASAFLIPPRCSHTKITARCRSQCIINSCVQARFLPSVTKWSAGDRCPSATYNILTTACRASWRACQPAMRVRASCRATSFLSVTHCHLSHSTVAATATLAVEHFNLGKKSFDWIRFLLPNQFFFDLAI